MAGTDFKIFDEASMEESEAFHPGEIVRVTFTNTFSYHLKFWLGSRIPMTKEHLDHTGSFAAMHFHYFLHQLCHKPCVSIDVSQ